MGFVCELPPGHSCDHEAVYNDTPLGRDYVYAPNVPSPAPPEGPRDAAPAQATCEWTEDSGGYWTTTCGKLFTAGRLSESHYRFCPYCGLTLQPVVFDDEVSADGAPGGER